MTLGNKNRTVNRKRRSILRRRTLRPLLLHFRAGTPGSAVSQYFLYAAHRAFPRIKPEQRQDFPPQESVTAHAMHGIAPALGTRHALFGWRCFIDIGVHSRISSRPLNGQGIPA